MEMGRPYGAKRFAGLRFQGSRPLRWTPPRAIFDRSSGAEFRGFPLAANPRQLRVSKTQKLKNRQKSAISPQKPKKFVENTRFSIDFHCLQAAL
jgi:hypothetical protein